MEPPQLRCAEAPMRAALGAPVPMFVDESVGNIRIQECQELGGASRRKRRVHGPAGYSSKLYLSAKSGQQHILRTICLLHVTYTETRNTLYYYQGKKRFPNLRLSGERQEESIIMCSRGVEFYTRPLQIRALTVWNQRNLFM